MTPPPDPEFYKDCYIEIKVRLGLGSQDTGGDNRSPLPWGIDPGRCGEDGVTLRGEAEFKCKCLIDGTPESDSLTQEAGDDGWVLRYTKLKRISDCRGPVDRDCDFQGDTLPFLIELENIEGGPGSDLHDYCKCLSDLEACRRRVVWTGQSTMGACFNEMDNCMLKKSHDFREGLGDKLMADIQEGMNEFFDQLDDSMEVWETLCSTKTIAPTVYDTVIASNFKKYENDTKRRSLSGENKRDRNTNAALDTNRRAEGPTPEPTAWDESGYVILKEETGGWKCIDEGDTYLENGIQQTNNTGSKFCLHQSDGTYTTQEKCEKYCLSVPAYHDVIPCFEEHDRGVDGDSGDPGHADNNLGFIGNLATAEIWQGVSDWRNEADAGGRIQNPRIYISSITNGRTRYIKARSR